MNQMNQEQFHCSWDELKTPLQKQWSKLTDEDIQRIAGDRGKFSDVIHSRYGTMKGEVSTWADRWYARWVGWYEGYEEVTPRA